jgi:hypothetical protein
MKPFRWLITLCLTFLLGCTTGRTYTVLLRYQPSRTFESLEQKFGSTLGIAPFKDQRPDTLHIGRHIPLRGVSQYFKNDPFPLEKAIRDSLSQALSPYGVKIVSVSDWDGKPDSLRKIETDSILMIEIKRFWIEGKALPFRTQARTWVHLMIHLGVKREGKVFTKNVEVEKEVTFPRLTLERVEDQVNKILMDILDGFLSNPYET